MDSFSKFRDDMTDDLEAQMARLQKEVQVAAQGGEVARQCRL